MPSCPACLREYRVSGHLQNHIRTRHPLVWKAMDDAYYDRMAKETDEFHAAVYETHEDGGNEVSTEPCSQFDDIPADIDDNTLTDSETHLRIPNPLVSQSLFGNFIEIEPDFELTDARNTEKPTKGVGISPDVSDCPDELTATVQLPGAPIMFDAGAIAYGPWTIDDLYRRDHMMQRIPTGFRDIGHYEFAEFLVKCKLPVDHINELLGSAGWINPEIRSSFHSHHTMMNRLKQLQVDLEMVEWERIELNERWPGIDLPVVVYRRNPAALVQVLLSQQTFVDDAVYGAVRQMEDGDRRVWGEMNTGDWWADQQFNLPAGATLVPVILMSDATHMTNFSGDKKAHPIYLTIGNLSSEVRTKPSSRATQLLAMLPPPPKRPDRSSEPVWREMKAQIRRVRNEALRVIMREFTDPDIMDGGIALCPDGQYRSIYMRIAAWIGDYQEHIDMQGLQSFRCPWCEVKPHELGKHIDEYEAEVGNGKRNTDNLRPRDRDHGEYKALFAQTSIPPPKPDDYRTQAEYRQAYQEYRDFLGDIRGKLTEAGVDAQYNPLWDLYQCQLPLLPKPDKLHTIYLGLVDHLMKWLTEMLQKYGRLHRFMEISKRIPPYLDMSAPRKSWMEVSQWTGREAKTMTRYLYATLAATLSEPPPKATEKEHFHDVLQATQALIEIVLYMEYDTHDEETLRLLRAAIRRFFAQKEAFLAYRAGKAARSTARAHHSHLVKERDAEIELARKDNKTPAEINEIRAFWAETIRIETQEAVEADSHFNFPKIHLLLHVVNSIEMFGSLGQFDSNISETAHKELKDGYRRSNRTGDWQIQVLNRWARSEAFDLRRNWQRKADEQRLHQSNMQPISDAFSSISVGDTPGRSRSLGFIPEGHTIPRPALFGPRVPTKKHGIPPIRTMFEVIESAKVHGFREAYEQYIKNSLDQPFSDNVHLRAPAGLYHGLELYNRKHGSEGRYRQRLRCTPGREWYGAKERKDWAWIQVNPSERRHDSNARMTTSAPRSRATLGALQGRLPVRLRCLFRVHLSDRSGKPRVFDLVLCEIPQPVDGGRPSESTGLVTVKRPGMPTANASRNQYQGYVNEEGANLLVFSAAVLDGPAHCVPLQHEGEELSWFVNPYIDLYTWNFVY